MTKIISCIHAFLWGPVLLVLILGVGIYLTGKLDFVQLRLFPQAMREFACQLRHSGGSSFRALCTALAATVGTGNLVGVAGAICLGGPGAVFWMWLCGILGMAVKYAEAALAVRFRVKTEDGFAGGSMYAMTHGLGEKFRPMARLYCFFGAAAAFGVGNTAQVNALVTSVESVFPLSISGKLGIGLILAVLVGKMLLGGAGRIGRAAEILVPFGAAAYFLMCAGVLLARWQAIPQAFAAIVAGAWDPRAVTGGMLGSAFQALRVGCARGVFTNEAGMGTAGIAHGGADVDHPARQGLMGILEVFLDTLVMCTLTALVILVSGVSIPYGVDAGGKLTARAFSVVYGEGAAVLIAGFMCLFAVATILGWSLYGGRCAQFLWGKDAWKGFALAQTMAVVFGAVVDTGILWQSCEILNGLMAIPNLISLAALSGELQRLTKEYRKSGWKQAGGGNYADFHQCKPLRALSHAEIPSAGSGSQKAGQEDLPSEHRPARSAHPEGIL